MPVYTLKPGTKPPDEVNVVVEIPKGSSIKYEIDPRNGRTSVDRILFPAMSYPCKQPGHNGEADPINVFILGNYSLWPRSVIACRLVGVILSEDQDGIDIKIIGLVNKYRSHFLNCSGY